MLISIKVSIVAVRKWLVGGYTGKLLVVIFIFISSCYNGYRNKSHNNIAGSSITKGKDLATVYCQSCHMLPDPGLLDAKTWESRVLPYMAPQLGIFNYQFKTYPSSRFDRDLNSGYYPSHPLITDEEWQDIINYYTASSPDSFLQQQVRPSPITKELSLFSVQTPSFTYSEPATSLVKIDTGTAMHELIISDAITQKIYRFNNLLQFIDSTSGYGGPVVNLYKIGKDWLACNIGVLNPNNGKDGKAQIIKTASNGSMQTDTTSLFSQLRRPVQVTATDLNNDGKTDYLICEFGYLQGSLSWMENKGNNQYERHILRPLPGAIKAYIHDYNHDGLPDIWVLFAQGEEGIFLFTNQGKGNFSQQELLRFPPIYGSSYFELADFNKDGYPDIIYTCGDNADYSPVLKPYHGVYIFMNDKTNHFVQKFFFPINGCYKAVARDFDNDGDLDIAAISFFADYGHQPEEGFVYLKNTGNFNFLPYTLEEAKIGRWLVMDAGDIDGDGRIDIVLGNFSIKPSAIPSTIDWKKGPPFIFLKNTGK